MKGDGGVNIDAAKLFNGPGQVEPRVSFFSPLSCFFLSIRRASMRVFFPSSLFSRSFFFFYFYFYFFLSVFFSFFRSKKKVRGRDKRSRGSTLLTRCAPGVARSIGDSNYATGTIDFVATLPSDESRSVGPYGRSGRFRRFPSCHASARCSFYSTNVSENHRGDEDV